MSTQRPSKATHGRSPEVTRLIHYALLIVSYVDKFEMSDSHGVSGH